MLTRSSAAGVIGCDPGFAEAGARGGKLECVQGPQRYSGLLPARRPPKAAFELEATTASAPR